MPTFLCFFNMRLLFMRPLLLLPFVAAFFSSAQSQAQGVRLDSLWGKIVGTVNAMSFSPDSKQLVLAVDDGWIRFYNATDGKLLDSIAPQYKSYQLQYSQDGTLLFTMNYKGGIEVYSSKDYHNSHFKGLDTEIGLREPDWIHSMDVSPDARYIALTVIRPDYNVRTNDVYQYMMVFSYPELQLLWQKEVPRYYASVKATIPAIKVAFSTDGNSLIGQYGRSVIRWNWKDTTLKNEQLLGDISPDKEVIAYSPDRNYCVVQSNYICSMQEKKLLNPFIEGLTKGSYSEYYKGVAFTASCNTVIITDNFQPIFVNLGTRTLIKGFNIHSASDFCLSPDSSMLASYGYRVRNDKIHWNVSSVDEESPTQEISIFPLPSKEQTTIVISTVEDIPFTRIYITDEMGIRIQTLYEGAIVGGKTFVLDNSTLASGSYNLTLEYGRSVVNKPFIITK